MHILKGLGVSSGVTTGHALRFTRNALELRVHLAEEDVEHELARLTTAQERSRQQLKKIREKVARSVSVDHAGVFDACAGCTPARCGRLRDGSSAAHRSRPSRRR